MFKFCVVDEVLDYLHTSILHGLTSWNLNFTNSSIRSTSTQYLMRHVFIHTIYYPPNYNYSVSHNHFQTAPQPRSFPKFIKWGTCFEVQFFILKIGPTKIKRSIWCWELIELESWYIMCIKIIIWWSCRCWEIRKKLWRGFMVGDMARSSLPRWMEVSIVISRSLGSF